MKLLFLLTYYSPHWTGLTQHARGLGEGLVIKGHTVRVLTTKHDPALSTTEIIRGVSVRRVPVMLRISRTLVSPALWGAMVGEIARSDAVVVYLPFAEALPAVLWARILGKKVFLIHNGDLMLPRSAINRLIEWIFYQTTALAVRLATKTIAYSMDYAKYSKLLSGYLDTCVAIFPPFEKLKGNKKEKQRLASRVGRHRYTIGFAGRFVEEKGFDVLLAAIPLVVARLPESVFVFAGETKMAYENFFARYKRTVTALKKHLVLLGLLPHDQMDSFYSLLDVFVLPSRSDCLGFVQVEAMLVGVPVVATNIPGARVAVQRTGMGVLVPSEDPQALAEGIIAVMTKKEEYVRRRIIAQQIFSYDRTLAAFEKILTKN